MSEERKRTRKAAQQGEREERLAAALRENLRRRKERARAQGTAMPEDGAGEEPPRSA
jgi:hypothetical protein